MPIRIHIADDHQVFREGLAALLDQQSDLCVCSQSDSTDRALEICTRTEVDVVLLDINMPGMPCIRCVESLLRQRPSLRVVMLTIHEEEHYLKTFLQAGAAGFMVKTSGADQLIKAIHAVMSGKQYVDSSLSHLLVEGFLGKAPKTAESTAGLTRREREVLIHLALGYTNSETADKLGISPRTVETHRTAIMTKLSLKNRAELVRYALRNGLLTP